MSLKNLKSIHDLVQGDTAPVGDMENQTGPNFPILGPVSYTHLTLLTILRV